ncbi:tail fiber assembly protein [Escherichia coli]|nr:tail fiber assembly protein [Escherichia coli]EGQ2064822.1 tail fiber assembly protein [Escherichia coli]EIY2093009.1 tail fiber assembly protein [Escherichia coli]EJC7859636.1 tail fiber assembly protein [Escherichia coli]EKS5109271.1 tail fiber assembly protein [Escherichia coli]
MLISVVCVMCGLLNRVDTSTAPDIEWPALP